MEMKKALNFNSLFHLSNHQKIVFTCKMDKWCQDKDYNNNDNIHIWLEMKIYKILKLDSHITLNLIATAEMTVDITNDI